MRITIDSDLLPMKGHYFLFNAGVAPVQPFMTVIAKDLNFSSTAVGIINAILPFAGMIAKPSLGAIADRFKLHKFVFISFQVLTVIGFFNVQFLPPIEVKTNDHVTLTCGAETNFEICRKRPDKDSECLIQDIIGDSNSNRTMKCWMKCDLSSELRTELCGPWRADPKICSDESATGPNVVEYTHYKETDGPNWQPKYSEPTDDVKLEFEALVPLKHTLKVADCLYFRVADAKMNDEHHHIPYCEHVIDTQCRITCDDPKISELVKRQCSECVNESQVQNYDFVYQYQFWLLLVLAICSWVGMAVVGSLADALCFQLLGERGSLYGYQRLWGSIGWGLFTILTGLVVDKFSTAEKTNYTPAFYIMLVVIVSDVVCSINLKYEQTKVSCVNIIKNVGALLKNVWIDLFLLWCIVMGMCVGVQWTFLFWHLEKLSACDQHSSKKTLLGLVGGVQCFLGELPSFFIFSWLVKKIGHVHIMSLIPFIVGIRFILYSVLPNPWWVLPIEVLQASLGLTFATMASYASTLAPPGAEATVQGLVGAIFEGIGVSLGSYLGGIIYQAHGGRGLFQIFAVVAFALCLIHGTVHYLLGQHHHRHFHASESTDEGVTSDSSLEDTKRT